MTWGQALVTLLVATIPALLVYRATRKRDKPEAQIKMKIAEDIGAKAASEAWAEYAAEMAARLDKTEGKLDKTEQKLDETKHSADACRVEVQALRRELATYKAAL